MKTSLSILAGTAGLLLAWNAAAAGKPLFAASKGKADARNEKALERLLANPSTRDVKIVRTDADASDGSEIELLLGGRAFTAERSRSERTASGSDVWYGRVQQSRGKAYAPRETTADPLNDVVLVRRDGRITGTARVAGQLYRIQPLPSGETAVIEVDENHMPADHPEAAYRALFDKLAQDKGNAASGKPCRLNCGGGSPVEPGATATIRVMVVSSNEARTGYASDLQALAELAIAESNQGFVNSNVGIQFELAGYYAADYAESGSFNTDLDRFGGTADGHLDGYHATRDQISADVNVLLIDNATSCGLGYLKSSASNAFSVVSTDCTTGYYSFAHEIGHNLGAHHDPLNGNNAYYSYGHGYQAPDRTWRTIMAYNCALGGCPRLNYWSNPAVTYGGQAMGTYDKSHNQRVLVERKATVAAFK